MQTDAEEPVFKDPAAPIHPFKITTASGRAIYALVIEDRVIACDMPQHIGAVWSELLARMVRSNATIEELPLRAEGER